jgi:hypothetical protein
MNWITALIDAPIKSLLFLAGLAFIAVGVVRRIGQWIDLDRVGRIAVFIIGTLFLIGAFTIGESSSEVGDLSTGTSAEVSSPQLEDV